MQDLEQMAQSLRILMIRLEQLLAILHQHQLVYWPDWGTLLGIERHRNVIPWDYDVDLCLPAADYQKLIAIFEQADGRIGDLELHKDYYGDPAGAFAILFADVPDASLGIDVVSYTQDGEVLRNGMSPQLQADYPGNYDFPLSQVLPLRWGQLLGQPVLMPQQSHARLAELFGDWHAFPEDHKASPLTASPFAVMPEEANADKSRGPWILRGALPQHRDAWTQPGYIAGMTSVWWLAETDARDVGVTQPLLDEAPFTELVYGKDRALWGKVWVGTLFPGDRLASALDGLSTTRPVCGPLDGR